MESADYSIANQLPSQCEVIGPTVNEAISNCYEMSTPPVSPISQQIPMAEEVAFDHRIMLPQYVPVIHQQPMLIHQQFPFYPQQPWHPISSQISTHRQTFPIFGRELLSNTIEESVVAIPKFGPLPTKIICPYCTMEITTKVKFEAGYRTHIIALFLFLFCCFIFMWLPYCIDACKVLKHYCPNCSAYLGAYNKQRIYGYNRYTGNIEVVDI